MKINVAPQKVIQTNINLPNSSVQSKEFENRYRDITWIKIVMVITHRKIILAVLSVFSMNLVKKFSMDELLALGAQEDVPPELDPIISSY
jgi:hypothetical protein